MYCSVIVIVYYIKYIVLLMLNVIVLKTHVPCNTIDMFTLGYKTQLIGCSLTNETSIL